MARAGAGRARSRVRARAAIHLRSLDPSRASSSTLLDSFIPPFATTMSVYCACCARVDSLLHPTRCARSRPVVLSGPFPSPRIDPVAPSSRSAAAHSRHPRPMLLQQQLGV